MTLTIPYHMMMCSAINAQGKEKEGHSWLWCCLPKQVVCAEAQLSRRWLVTCPMMGSNEEIPFFFFSFAYVEFFLNLLKLLLSQSASLLTFLLFSPCPAGEESEQAALWVFGWGQPNEVLS